MKVSLSDLAFAGGVPLFGDEPLHVGRPNIGDRDRLRERLDDLLDRRWLSNGGVYERAFEQAVADRLGVRHCVAMCNGTIALEIAVRACGLSGEVIVPSFTFVATAHALQWQAITPVFADVDPRTHTLDPAAVERMITPRTTGIVGVHVWGQGCDVHGLADVAKRHHLRLLYDGAHAFDCTAGGGRPVASFGDATVLSFHATKFINAFEGGAVVTDSDELARTMRLMRNFGFAGVDSVVYVGTNGKMSEASAAMGLTSLEAIDDILAVNHAHDARYRAALDNVPGVRVYDYAPAERVNHQYVIVEVDAAAAGIDRDRLVDVLHAEGVLARRYFYPACHRMEPYRSFQPHAGLMLPHTEALATRVMSLPTGTGVSADEVDDVAALVRLAVAHGPELMAMIPPAA